jgi:hypothetical protein
LIGHFNSFLGLVAGVELNKGRALLGNHRDADNLAILGKVLPREVKTSDTS